MTATAGDPAFDRTVLDAAAEAFDRVMAGMASPPGSVPPDLEPLDALRWAGDRVTELLAGFAELPLDRLFALDGLLATDGQATGDGQAAGDGQATGDGRAATDGRAAGDPGLRDGHRGSGGAEAGPRGEPVSTSAPAGAEAVARIWVHRVGEVSAATIRFELSDLLPAAGPALPGGSAIFEPAELRLPAPVGASTVVRYRIPPGTATGSYHGLVLGRGVADAVVPITMVVR